MEICGWLNVYRCNDCGIDFSISKETDQGIEKLNRMWWRTN